MQDKSEIIALEAEAKTMNMQKAYLSSMKSGIQECGRAKTTLESVKVV